MSKAFWTRIYVDPDVTIDKWDCWKSGEGPNGHHILCFALRADDPSQIHDLLDQTLDGGSYQVDFVEPKEWQVYGDFAGPQTRWPMADKYLQDPIDHVSKFLRLRDTFGEGE